MAGPTGVKTLQQLTIEAINAVKTDNVVTRELIVTENIKIITRLQLIEDQMKINNKHNEIITDEEIISA